MSPTPAEIARRLTPEARYAVMTGRVNGIRILAELAKLMDADGARWNDIGLLVRAEIEKESTA